MVALDMLLFSAHSWLHNKRNLVASDLRIRGILHYRLAIVAVSTRVCHACRTAFCIQPVSTSRAVLNLKTYRDSRPDAWYIDDVD